MILDLGPIPAHARRAFMDEHGVYFDLTREADTSPTLGNLDPEGPARKPPAPASTPDCLPRFSRWAPAVVLSLSSLAACGRSAASPVADPPSASRGAVVIDALDAIAIRLGELDTRRGLALECAEACIPGVERLTYAPGELRCECRKLPSLGVHRLPRKAARLQTSARSERVGEPGAASDRAGLVAGGAR